MDPPDNPFAGFHRRPIAIAQARGPGAGSRPDNTGAIAWQNNEEPRDKVVLARNVNSRTHQSKIVRIARDTDTYIELSDRARAYLIWGNPHQVASAKSLVENVVAEGNPQNQDGKKPASWAKLPSYTVEARRINEVKLDNEDLKQALRRIPPADAVFESIGSFVWPEDGCRPQDIFGSDLRNLDPIRIECSCYIVYEDMSGTFRAMGKKSNVQEAIVRLRAAFFQLTARQIKSFRTYNLHWRDAAVIQGRVKLIKYLHSSGTKNSGALPTRIALTPRGYGVMPEYELQQQPSNEKHLCAVAKKVKDLVMQTLNKIKYYRGSVDLRVRLGTFLISHPNENTEGGIPLARFETMLSRENLLEGSVTPELGDRRLEHSARQRLIGSGGFLVTRSTFVHRLADVKPVYTAILTLDPNDNGGFVQLRKSWAETDNDLVETHGPLWYRLDRGSSEAKYLMETCVVDLEDGLSWQFEMQASTPMSGETLSPSLQSLGTYHFNISKKKAENINKHELWCEFEQNEQGFPRLVPRKKALNLSTTWQFGIVNSDYTVEVAKTQRRTFEAHSIPGKEEMTTYEPRWSVQVVHKNWETNLAENANLGIGKSATWRADLETWFPSDDAIGNKENPSQKTEGHVEMMKKLFHIQAIIRGEEAQH